MKDTQTRPLFIFEMANNHGGSVEHAVRIVRAMREASRDFPFAFAVKLQYRDLDTFIHPDHQKSDSKHIKRFRETRLTREQYLTLVEATRATHSITRAKGEGTVVTITSPATRVLSE